MFQSDSRCSLVFLGVSRCFVVFKGVQLTFKLFRCVHRCSKVFQGVPRCSKAVQDVLMALQVVPRHLQVNPGLLVPCAIKGVPKTFLGVSRHSIVFPMCSMAVEHLGTPLKCPWNAWGAHLNILEHL